MSWQGKILRVDLDGKTCLAEPLNLEWAEQYLGQRGLATKYLTEETDPRVDPLSPENRLIFATGPLTGTAAATGGRYSVVTKGALTGAVACSNSGGDFGAEIKFAGFDMIIIQGRASSPVYLLVTDDEATLVEAGDLWGKSVWQTEPAIRARHMNPDLKVASIGRAGEIGVLYASVINDLDRAAGRSGVGAVMGAKNLKAIAVSGSKGLTVDDPPAFQEAAARARAKISPERLIKSGTMGMMDVIQAFGGLPTRNSREVQFEGTGKINAPAMRAIRPGDGKANLITNKACFACTIGCGRVCSIDPTHFSVRGKPQYLKPGGGLEYETAYALGPAAGIDDLEAATYANFICNEHGMDTISFGGTLAAAMELYLEGVITKADTGGVGLEFGSAGALVKMAEMTAAGQGFGLELGLGARRMCEKFGRPDLAMVARGQEFPGYDGRAMPGMALAYATSNRGACHLRASPYEDDFAGGAIGGKAKAVKESQDRIAITDSAGICAFPSFTLEDFAEQLEPALGGGWTVERLKETGERIWNLERLFNIEAGCGGSSDTLPGRILNEPAKSGARKGLVAELEKTLPQYYLLRGWDKDGTPTPETIERLGI
ncbi:MAG: aldehyde ferredoxin oxidoreductase family protein [Rhodospirillales bacterium]